MAAQIAKYTQASLSPKNSAAATQLQSLRTAFVNWKQQNPGYAPLISQRDALANQIQTETAAKAQRDAQAAQFLTTPQYVQWNGNTPPAPTPLFGEQGTSAPSSDLSIHDLDSRAGIIAAQTGYPAGLAYASALQEARQQGSHTVDGSSIDDAIAGVQPVAEAQLPKMPGAQLSKALQAGLITRQQLITAVKPRNTRSDQTAAPTDNTGAVDSAPVTGAAPDPVAQSVAGLTAKAADLRQKIQTAFDTGGADGARDLATYRAALADTEDQLHAGTQSLLNRVPADLQRRIANAVAPNIDWNDAVAQRTSCRHPFRRFVSFPKLARRFGNALWPWKLRFLDCRGRCAEIRSCRQQRRPRGESTEPKTEFQASGTFPKRCANFGNEKQWRLPHDILTADCADGRGFRRLSSEDICVIRGFLFK